MSQYLFIADTTVAKIIIADKGRKYVPLFYLI
jgi:hypothetical protein